MHKTAKRVLKKSISWRVITIISSFGVSLLITGNMFNSLKLTIVLNIINALLYAGHELIWRT